MRTVLRGVTVLAMDDVHGTEPFTADVAFTGGQITDVATHVDPAGADRVVDGARLLVLPGLVNAHVHSWEGFFRGRYDNLPLELWMLLAYPVLGVTPLAPELIRLRSLLLAVESLRNGVTCLLDDVIEMPGQSLDAIGAVFDAYDEAGIRASCSGAVADRPLTEWIPFADELLAPAAMDSVLKTAVPSTAEYLAFSEEVLASQHGRAGGRLRYVISPSGPQRCTDDLLLAADELSRRHAATFHIHVLETRLQAMTGQQRYGMTLVEHLARLGVLSDRAVLAHAIWLTDEDIGRLATSGAAVVHNPISNLKLGSGIAPWRALHEAGVPVALGTDGISSCEAARMFDVMKLAGLLHSMSDPNYQAWPTASEVLWAATRGGARAVKQEGLIGAIAPGYRADLVLVRLDTLSFTPRSDLRNHLVYSENGTSVTEVIVDGQTVVADGRVRTVDEEALLAEVRAVAPGILRLHADVERANDVFRPWVDRVYQEACRREVGVERWAWRPAGRPSAV
jgi:5-methylthioadenosine/S-adenosylhomocysteine deaminase